MVDPDGRLFGYVFAGVVAFALVVLYAVVPEIHNVQLSGTGETDTMATVKGPVILLSPEFEDLPAPLQAATIAHERTHVFQYPWTSIFDREVEAHEAERDSLCANRGEYSSSPSDLKAIDDRVAEINGLLANDGAGLRDLYTKAGLIK